MEKVDQTNSIDEMIEKIRTGTETITLLISLVYMCHKCSYHSADHSADMMWMSEEGKESEERLVIEMQINRIIAFTCSPVRMWFLCLELGLRDSCKTMSC